MKQFDICKKDLSVDLSIFDDPGELYDRYTTATNKNYMSIETDQMQFLKSIDKDKDFQTRRC